jgi:hypothetical protein
MAVNFPKSGTNYQQEVQTINKIKLCVIITFKLQKNKDKEKILREARRRGMGKTP